MAKIINNWKELSEIPNESQTHILEVNVNDCNGWLRTKEEKEYNSNIDFLSQVKHLDVYLSTHTFYEDPDQYSTKLLQACGFDVELAN